MPAYSRNPLTPQFSLYKLQGAIERVAACFWGISAGEAVCVSRKRAQDLSMVDTQPIVISKFYYPLYFS